ncbi:MAG TPA: GNAT family N-acetyltransferase, partial [Thermoanaerobaculaceae bacterium]|nr:GNAT family N-acetyltransferase [Thermoanaerobaculaceae bacterium]
MTTDFLTRAYEPGDETAILGLFHRAFHSERSLAHWRWKYAQSPFGRFNISLTFAATGELAAHYAGYPVPFHEFVHGEAVEHATLQIGDTMTAPEFRHVGRGSTSVLGRAVQHFYATFCDAKVAFNYGFNTANIQRLGLRFFNVRRIEDVGYWVLENPRPRLRGTLPFSLYRIEPVSAVGPEWDQLYGRLAPRFPAMVARTASYLDWRYLRCPDPGFQMLAARRRTQLVGWIVVRKAGDDLIWGDALLDPDHTGAAR